MARRKSLSDRKPSNLRYRKIYKYCTYEDQLFETSVETGGLYTIPWSAKEPGTEIGPDPWIILHPNGDVWIRKGYSWDGASGPTIDTENSMTASLVHDALYQLMRDGTLSLEWRKEADKTFKAWCRHDGMGAFRAEVWYRAVRAFGRKFAKPNKPRNPNVA
jgi:hypothetical protein